MDNNIPRRRGRPRGSIKVPRDLHAGILNTVRLHRISERRRTGKTPSVRQACRDIAAHGGIISVVGGDQHALAKANLQMKKRWQRFQFESNGSSLRPNATGSVFVNHAITNPGTLEARYSEANKIARSDRRVRLFWMNIARQMLGRPIKKPRWG
jgi:ribosomal protein L30/L7E